jgi:hypothetical protein
MGKDYVMLDTWRETHIDECGDEFVLVKGKRLYVDDLKNYCEVHNVDWKKAIEEGVKLGGTRELRKLKEVVE